jgi:hypothetical protein
MTIAIPAIIDTHIANLRAALEPVVTGATNTASSPLPPIAEANRVADILDLLCGLVDSGTLTVEGIHKVADATNPTSEADATDLTSAQTLLNALKTDANAHFLIVGANEHVGADVTNSIDAANATNQATAETLANEEKADINAHMALAAATGHYVADPANVISAADATDLASLLVLANEIKAKYNAHIASINGVSVSTINDRTAFTGSNTLVGSTITFGAATTTVALRGVSRAIASHTGSVLTVAPALPAIPVEADVFTLAFTPADAEIAALRDGKATGDMASNPYNSGPALANSVLKVLELLGRVQQSIATGTGDGAGTSTTLIDSGETWGDDTFNGKWVEAGTGGNLDVVNLRKISDTVDTTITVANAFTVAAGTAQAPGVSTEIEVLDGMIYTGTAAAGAASSLTCPATISFAANELQGLTLVIVSGTGIGQWRNITGNSASVSSVITVDQAWDTNPDGTSVFEIRYNTTPAYLVSNRFSVAEPFGLLSPHGAGSGNHGHAGATLVGDLLQYVRDTINRYTVPA